MPNFCGYDGLGVRQLTHLAGSITDTYAYDAFGNLLNSTGTTSNDFRYRGEQYDPALGLQYLRARYYNPATGRFTSRDPWSGATSAPKTLHKYSYAGGNPINERDPSGWAATGEYAAITKIQTRTTPAVIATGAAVDCVLYTSAAALLAVAADKTDRGTIAAIAFGGLTCGASVVLEAAAEAAAAEAEVAEAEAAEGEAADPAGEPDSETIEGCPECFAAGTPVHTDQGDVPIERIQENDRVLARNRETGALEYERVSALVPGHPGKLVDIRVEGEAAPLRPSISHPFWVRRGDDSEGAWIPSEHMLVGDLVQALDNRWARVVGIKRESETQTVHNFTVDQDHDYFVGHVGILVHNAPFCGCRWGQEGHHIVAEKMKGFDAARDVLTRAGIDINDLINLLQLDALYHERIHTTVYKAFINKTLTDAEITGEYIPCTLQKISALILAGKVPF